MLSVVLVHQNQRHLQEGGEEKGRELRDRSRYSFKVLILNNVAWLKLHFILPCTQVGSDAHLVAIAEGRETVCVLVCVHVSKCVSNAWCRWEGCRRR